MTSPNLMITGKNNWCGAIRSGIGTRTAGYGNKTLILTVASTFLAATLILLILQAMGIWEAPNRENGKSNPTGGKPTPPQNENPVPPQPPPPSPPAPGTFHPLAGERHIFLASRGVPSVNGALNWAPELHDEIGHPIATVEKRDAPTWRFEGVPEMKDHYRIYLQSSIAQWDGAELSYTRASGMEYAYVTAEKNDPNSWQVRKVSGSGSPPRYAITCELGKKVAGELHGEELRVLEKDEHLDWPHAVVAIGRGGISAEWHVLRPGEKPEPLDRDFVIVFPRKDLQGETKDKVVGWANEMQGHVDAGTDDFRLWITRGVEDAVLDCTDSYKNWSGEKLYQHIRKNVREDGDALEDILPGSVRPPDGAPPLDFRQTPPFPLVFPIESYGDFEIEEVWKVWFWDGGYPGGREGSQTLEKLDDFQSNLDLDFDIRCIFHGDFFTYVFVTLPADAEE